jgi:hypothetical protein
MDIVLIVVGVVLVAGVVALLVVNPKLEARKTRALDATTNAAAGSEILLRDDAASCFGVEHGDDKPRHFGEGSAALTAQAFIFTPTLSGATTVVPRTAIREVIVDSSHIIKSVQTPALKLVWVDGDADSVGRWRLASLDRWVQALGGTTTPVGGDGEA